MALLNILDQSPVILLLGSLTCIASYGIILALYRLTIHPLAGFPGRKLAAITHWYEFYHDVVRRPAGQFYLELEKMHDEYGPIVRISPNEIHIRDSEYHRVLYAPGSRRNKAPAMAKMVGTPKSSFGTIPHDLHKLRRGPNGVMFSQKAIHGPVQDILLPETDNLSKIFQSMYQHNETRDIRELCLGYSSVFASQYFIGSRFSYLDDREELSRWYRAVEALPKGTPILRQMPWLIEVGVNLPRWIPRLLSPEIARTLALHDLLRDEAKAFLNSPEAIEEGAIHGKKTDLPKTIFHAIQRHNLPAEEKSIDRLWQEAFSLYIGGLDTTTRTMAAAIVFLLLHPTHLTTLLHEIDTLMPDPAKQPDYKLLEHTPFLTAVIKETLRRMHLVSGRIPLTCEEPLAYHEHSIPTGSIISMSNQDILTDATIFTNPHIFDPTRWLRDGALHHDLDTHFVAFSRGPRACPGKQSAWALMYRGLCAVLRRFELELVDFDYDRDFKVVSDFFYGDPSPQAKGWNVRVKGVRT